jgi:hypothetical protein
MLELPKILEELSARARLEDAPVVDVSSRVLHRLGREAPSPIWPMAIFASSASVAALAVLIFSFPLITALTDPWSEFFLDAVNALI